MSIFEDRIFEDPENRMFMGTFDDSVSRYPWVGMTPNIEYLNRLIIFQAILGPKLCCRIGNILYHQEYYLALIDKKISPLQCFAENGFIQLQMKGISINETISIRKDIGTNSTLKFIERNNWKIGSSTYNNMSEINNRLSEKFGIAQYDSSFNQEFKKIMRTIGINSKPPFREIYKEWIKTDDEKNLSRSRFEEIGKVIHKRAPEKLHRAMQIANSANHYAYGSGSFSHSKNVIIETEEITILNGMTRTLIGQEERKESISRYLRLIRLGAFDVIEKNLEIPVQLIHDKNTWEKFAKILHSSNKNNDEYMNHKRKIILLIGNILCADEGKELENKIAELADESRKYSDFIYQVLNIEKRKKYPIIFKFAVEQINRQGIQDTLGLMAERTESIIDEAPYYIKYPAQFAIRILFHMFTDENASQITRVIDKHLLDETDISGIYPNATEVVNAFRYPSIKIMDRG